MEGNKHDFDQEELGAGIEFCRTSGGFKHQQVKHGCADVMVLGKKEGWEVYLLEKVSKKIKSLRGDGIT